ncbi:MAG: hypothetical protein R3F62_00535 [Planctomycetota bacterium]
MTEPTAATGLRRTLASLFARAGRLAPVLGGTVWLAGCGRPFRLDGELQEPEPAPTPDWLLPVALDPAGCGPALRMTLRAEWLRAAAAEHASVASFARVAQQLLAAGAPPALVQRALLAAQDEVRHAQLCYSLASAYGGQALGPAPFPAACVPERRPTWTRPELLERLALEALTDGCLNEGFATVTAAAAAERALVPAVQKVWSLIAGDEATHAELGWAVLAWCLEQEPTLAARVEHALETLPDALPTSAPLDLAEQQRAHGLLAQGERERLFARTRAAVYARGKRLLAPRRAAAG